MSLEPDLDLARRFVAASEIPGRVVLVGITGSHHYGFPSPDSDLDIKAIHLAPTQALLGLRAVKEGFDRLEVFERVECDLTSNEAQQALGLLLRGNGNMLERILCPYQLVESEEVEQLQVLARGAICKRFFRHYGGFFRGVRREAFGRGEGDAAPLPESAEPATAKAVLYAYRVGLTGVHLLLGGELEANLGRLAEPYGFAEALPLIEKKRATREKVPLDAVETAHHRQELAKLEVRLQEAFEASPLPEEPANAAEIEGWLIERRLAELGRGP